MLTEEHVRHLLAEAATTIKPGPEPDVAPPPREWRLPLIATAAVLVVAGTIAAASLFHGGGAPNSVAPSPSVTSTPAPSPSVQAYLGDPSFHLGPDQIPAVSGYPVPIATRILRQHGWVVSERPQSGCPANTATAVDPDPGTVTPPGTIVVLTVNANGASDSSGAPTCPVSTGPTSGNADPFLLWVEGLAGAPSFSSGVQYIDGTAGVDVWLDPVEAQSLANWPHLSDLASTATTPDVRRPLLGLAIVPRRVIAGVGPGCSPSPPSSVPALCGTRTLTIRSGDSTLMSVRYTVTANGSIDTVTLSDHRPPPPQGSVPSVVGDSQAYATGRLQAWGYVVTPVYRVDCAPAGLVSRIAVEGRNAFIGVATGTGQCDSSPLMPALSRIVRPGTRPDHYGVTAARTFVAFARGEARWPAWSDRVTYTVNGSPVRTLTTTQAQRAESWQACQVDHGHRACALSPLAMIGAVLQDGGSARIIATPAYSRCLPAPGRLPRPADAASGTVTIVPGPGHAGCATVFYVTLGIDPNDRVSSVDLSVPLR